MNNAQDDVTGIFDEDGDLVVTYVCDNAWGYNPIPDGPLATTIGTLNPLRYRGYVYDAETGYYYLQSRYYDPEIGRFINADGLVTTGGLLGNNMFAYCGNNPVNRIDPHGNDWKSVVEDVVEAIVEGIRRVLDAVRDVLTFKEDKYLTSEQRQYNATLVYYYLTGEGWSHNATCAVLGNMEQESTINPGLHQRGGGAFGIVQWDPATKYTNWADQNGYAYNSLTGQLKFLLHSMQPGKGEWFKNAKHPNYYLPYEDFRCSNASVEYLTAVFLHSYERAGIPMLDTRIKYALYWSDYFS